MFKRIVVTGSLAYDHIMSMPGSFSDHIMPDKIHVLNVSFIMKTFRREFGGCGGNIAYSLTLLKTPTLLVSTAGNDFHDYLKHLESLKNQDYSGIKIFKDVKTAQGFVTTDKNDNQIWGFYEGAMKKAKNLSLKNFFADGDFLVIAPNDPIATIKFIKEAVSQKIPYLFDPAFNIPHFTKRDLQFSVKNSAIMIGNDYEIELIKRKLNLKKIPENEQIWITTLGAKGSLIKKGKAVWPIPIAKPKNSCDPTGAGDAYRSGFLSGYFKRFPLEVCGRMGALSAAYTVEAYGTQTHHFTLEDFKRRFKQNFKIALTI